MQALQKRYVGKGVVWYSVNSSAPGKQGNFPATRWNELIKEKGVAATAVLLDPQGTVGKAYGARTTPHIFVINAEGVLVYKGAIDDKPSVRKSDVASARNYVAETLDGLLAGKAVAPKETAPYGCSVKY
jgi:hypothetical protein